MEFIGRKNEQKWLKGWENRLPGSQLTVMYGRRRIGKTRLVLETFKDDRLLRFEGLENQSTSVQKKHFLEQLAQHTGRTEIELLPSTISWTRILGLLADYLSEQTKDGSPIILFFDEFQWMAAERADLVSRLKYVWDTQFSALPVHLIICGSISSFLVHKVIRSKALYGRIHLEINLRPLSLPETRQLIPKRSLLEVTDLYMAVGGIPQYLEMIDPEKSVQLNLQELCFSPHGFLLGEYDRIFASHFGRNVSFQKIINALAKKRLLHRNELLKASGLKSGGTLSRYLEELELAGFIERFVPVGRPQDSKISRYRLTDPYLQFYFQFIRPSLHEITTLPNTSASRWMPDKVLLPWRGIAFERLCLAHSHMIAETLGFGAVKYRSGSWFKRADHDVGSQIDLLYLRDDRVISLCEIKYRQSKIGKGVIAEVEKKMESYPKSIHDTVEPILISASAPAEDLKKEGYFNRILSLEDLFGSR